MRDKDKRFVCGCFGRGQPLRIYLVEGRRDDLPPMMIQNTFSLRRLGIALVPLLYGQLLAAMILRCDGKISKREKSRG